MTRLTKDDIIPDNGQRPAFILLGSNLGDRQANLLTANRLLKTGGEIIRRSSIYQSEAWGVLDQPAFLNQVICIMTTKTPQGLLACCQEVENTMGRVRRMKWGDRIIDADILYYARQAIRESDLVVPHPGIAERRFTLVPLVEIAGEFVHPVLKKTNRELLEACTDPLSVRVFSHL